MLDRDAAESPGRPPAAAPRRGPRGRRRALVACAVLALALHALFIGQIGGLVAGTADPSVAPISVRTVPEEPPVDVPAPTPAVAPVAIPVPAPRPARPLRQPREPAVAASRPPASQGVEASANSSESSAALAQSAGARDASLAVPADVPLAAIPADAPASVPSDAAEATAAAAAGGDARSAPSLLAAGDEPPPLYRTRMPPSVTLHYQVRRGFLRGTGQIRWQPDGDRYRLALEANVAGLTLLIQTSEGVIDANGLAPVRFLDQRARRSPQAANFRRDDGRITFSGTGVEWPLVPGSQDRLSWMIQLAGIAAAEPERLVDGGRITMVVVGARGDAGIWTLRYAGRETIETAWGTVHAVKLVREGRSAYDTSAEIWLDPERSYLPAHATLRNSGGASEYDLLLERVDPG